MPQPALDLPRALGDATEDQPAARAALAAALADPLHAYLLAGPPGSSKRVAARAFAAELLAADAADPDDVRRRVLADPSPHPDLVWLRPQGTQHLVDEVRERVIVAAAYRPFEGTRRAFVIEAAETMADESQNALLKTLEEPGSFVHLILITSEPTALLETVRSRCQAVRFAPLAQEAVEAQLAERGLGDDDQERRAAARLGGGDADRAAFLLGEQGRALRGAARACVMVALSGELGDAPWRGLLKAAEAAGEQAARATQERSAAGDDPAEGREGRRRSREVDEAAKRAARRARTEALDLGLMLVAAWLRDLAAITEDADGVVLSCDRLEDLRAATASAGIDSHRARRGAELVMETRRRLDVNVGEELALEALVFRLEALLRGT